MYNGNIAPCNTAALVLCRSKTYILKKKYFSVIKPFIFNKSSSYYNTILINVLEYV